MGDSASQVAKRVIEEVMRRHGVGVVKVFLFGSRARGNFGEDSNWDFLVVVDRELGFNEKWDIVDEIKRRLAKLSIPNDIIVRSEQELSETSKLPGTISFAVAREGVPL